MMTEGASAHELVLFIHACACRLRVFLTPHASPIHHSSSQEVGVITKGEKMTRAYKYYDFIVAFFVAVLLISNIASAAKIIDWGVNILGLPLAFDAGTLLFPISYIFGDILTEVYGYKQSRRVIWAGFGTSLLMAAVFWLVGRMPGEATWQQYAGQGAYEAILGGVASGGIVIASLCAYFAGEFSNSYILAKLKIATAGRWLWLRTISSTLVGEGID